MFWPWGLTSSIAKVVTVVHEKFWQKLDRNPDHQKVHGHSTWKLAKLGIFQLWGTFDLQNGTFLPWGLNDSISKVLTEVHENIFQKWCRNSESPKSPWTTAHDNRQNGEHTRSGAQLTFKMGRFWPWGLTCSKVMVLTVVLEKFWKTLCRNSRLPKSLRTLAHENRQN